MYRADGALLPLDVDPNHLKSAQVTANKRRKWSQRVTQTSHALRLEPGVFTYQDPRRIAQSLKRSAEHSRRRKADPFRSAMSMLTFYINRAGGQLTMTRRKRLERAKEELRKLFGKAPRGTDRGVRR
jgi:hypothetical protein